MKHFLSPYLKRPHHPINVSLIGLGGTGGYVISALVTIHQSLQALNHPGLHVTAYDDDVVTEANLGRQRFYASDLGLNKALVLIQRINRNFMLSWRACSERFTSETQESGNIVFSCVDSVQSRLQISDALKGRQKLNAHKRPYYWIDYGNSQKSGQVILGTLGNIPQPDQPDVVSTLETITEIYDLTMVNEEEQGPSCSLADALEKQDLFINSCLASLGCNLIWGLFKNGYTSQRGLFLNLETLKVNPLLIN